MSTATGPVTEAKMPSVGTVGVARAQVELKQFFRDRQSMMFTFALPLILLLVFGSVFDTEIAPGVTFSQYFLAGMIASGLVYTGFQNLAIQIPQEREDGTLKRLAGTPLPRPAYFVGKIALVFVALVAQVFLLLLIGNVMDLTPTILVMGPVLMPIVIVAGIDPTYFGVMFILVGTLGLIHPPVCTVLNVVCGVAKISLESATRGVWPFLLAEAVLVFLFVAFPGFITVPMTWFH